MLFLVCNLMVFFHRINFLLCKPQYSTFSSFHCTFLKFFMYVTLVFIFISTEFLTTQKALALKIGSFKANF